MNRYYLMLLFLCTHVIFSFQLSFADVLFSDDFELGDLSHTDPISGAKWNVGDGGGGEVPVVSNSIAYTGAYSLKFHFSGNANLSDDAWSEQRFTLGQTQTDVYARFFIYFPSNYVHRTPTGPSNNKFFDLWGTKYSQNTRLMQTWAPPTDSNVVEQFVFSANGGTSLSCSGSVDNVTGGRWLMPASMLGKWTAIEIHNKMDDGSGNGEMELWVNGDLKISIKGMSWSGAPCAPRSFRDGYLLGWANSGFDKDTDIYIDDVVFSTEYISPLPLTASSLLPPSDFQRTPD